MAVSTEAERLWVKQWETAGPALAEQRKIELRNLTEEEALAAAEALLSLVTMVTLATRRRGYSGLVEQQALFHRQPK